MLKIKDDVDLKELEKYGFKYFENDFCKGYIYDPKYYINIEVLEEDFMSHYGDYVVEPKRILLLNPGTGYSENKEEQKRVFDKICSKLIKDGLVEKVGNRYENKGFKKE